MIISLKNVARTALEVQSYVLRGRQTVHPRTRLVVLKLMSIMKTVEVMYVSLSFDHSGPAFHSRSCETVTKIFYKFLNCQPICWFASVES